MLTQMLDRCLTLCCLSCRIMYRELKECEKEKESGKMVTFNKPGLNGKKRFLSESELTFSSCRTSVNTASGVDRVA